MNLLTAKQVAIELDISHSLVRRYCREGRLGQKIGGRYIITSDDLEKFKQIPRKVGKPPKQDG